MRALWVKMVGQQGADTFLFYCIYSTWGQIHMRTQVGTVFPGWRVVAVLWRF